MAEFYHLYIVSYFRYFKKPLNIYFEFIPQLIFMLVIFGYLILLIFVKWLKFDHTVTEKAPNLLIGGFNQYSRISWIGNSSGTI